MRILIHVQKERKEEGESEREKERLKQGLRNHIMRACKIKNA